MVVSRLCFEGSVSLLRKAGEKCVVVSRLCFEGSVSLLRKAGEKTLWWFRLWLHAAAGFPRLDVLSRRPGVRGRGALVSSAAPSVG